MTDHILHSLRSLADKGSSEEGEESRVTVSGPGQSLGTLLSSSGQWAPDGSAGWMLPATSAVVVVAEILFGASPSWTPPFTAGGSGDPRRDASSADVHKDESAPRASAAQSASPSSSSSPSPPPLSQPYEAVSIQVLQEIVRPRLWNLQTSSSDDTEGNEPSPSHKKLMAQVSLRRWKQPTSLVKHTWTRDRACEPHSL